MAEESRRQSGVLKAYRLRPEELAALKLAKERAQATLEAQGIAALVTDGDMVGTALIVHERVTRGDLVTLRLDALEARLTASIETYLDELRRELAAQTADFLAKHGVNVNVTMDETMPVDREAVSAMIHDAQRAAFERPRAPARANQHNPTNHTRESSP